ncbi:geranylgeranylglycerol-phosphate geranylgeranyltransferase [Wenyingzhuangia sp. IMCC45533]
MNAWFCLIRWKNLLLVAFSQILILLFVYTPNKTSANNILYICITLLLTAAGNIINDYFDIDTDKINKPKKVIIDDKISKQKAINIYYVLTAIAITLNIISFYFYHNLTLFTFINLTAVLLYIYSCHLKQKALIGNILIAALTGLSIFLISLVIPSNSREKQIIYLLVFFAFLLNLNREIIKDAEDIRGDRAAKLSTLPILIGIKRTCLVLKATLAFTTLCLVFVSLHVSHVWLKAYLFLFIVFPLVYCYYLLHQKHKKNLFTQISTILKLIIAFGIFTVLFL